MEEREGPFSRRKMMRNSGVIARLATTFGVAAGVPALILSIPGHTQSVKALKSDEEEMRRTMIQISRQLGVECTACHNTKNFRSAEKVEFRIAKEHMRITQMLIDNGFDGREKRPKADCFMCHRGVMKPPYKEPFDPMTMENQKIKAPSGEPETE